MTKAKGMSRRQFVSTAAGVAAISSLAPKSVLRQQELNPLAALSPLSAMSPVGRIKGWKIWRSRRTPSCATSPCMR